MKKIITLLLIIGIVLCSVCTYAAPHDNFEYIDYPGTKYIFSATNGYIFHMLDGSKICLDEYGNETDDIVGVMGQNVFFFDEETVVEHSMVQRVETEDGIKDSYREELFENLYLYDNNNKLITMLSARDYEVVERPDYIAVTDTTKPLETQTFTIYSKTDGSIVSELPAKDYLIGNTYYPPTGISLTYWYVTKCGYFVFADESGLCGISDIKGNIIVEPRFTRLEVCDAERDLFMAKSESGIFIIDKDGNILNELVNLTGLAQVSQNNDDLIRYTASEGNGMGIPLDKDFNRLDFYDENYSVLWELDNDHFVVEPAGSHNNPNALRGIMNSKGEIVLPLEYANIRSIGGRLVQAYNTIGSQTLADIDGNIIEENCSFITEVGDNGYIGIGKMNAEGRRDFEGYINKSGKRVITLPDGYRVHGTFREGKAAIGDDWNAPWRNGGSTVYIDESGKVIIDDPNQEWYNGQEFKNNIALVANNLGKSGAFGWLLIKYIGDTPSDWAETSVNAAIKKNLLPIDEPYRLNSMYHENITREEFCVIAAKVISAITGEAFDTTPTEFTDTDNSVIFGLCNAGIIDGKSKTQFAPKDLLTREEAAKILDALYTHIKIERPQIDESYNFNDHDEISTWARYGVYSMNAAEIMLGIGNNKFAPKDNYTKEQAIVTLMRVYDASRVSRTVMFETDKTIDTEKTISGFSASISKNDNGVFEIEGDNLEYLDYIHITTSKDEGLIFGFSLYQRVMFQTEELSQIMWDISNVRYDGEILQESPQKANEHIKINVNGEPVEIAEITQGKGNGHTDFYLYLDKVITAADINTIDIVCK